MSEASHQEAFFQWLDLFPNIRHVSFAIPNGGKRSLSEAKRLKRQGVTAGVPDVFIAIPNDTYHGLFIEFKYGKNKLTREQHLKSEYFQYNKYQFVICYGWQEAREVVKKYINSLHQYYEYWRVM